MAIVHDVVYGFPCVENPHDFSPDRESCTPEEIAFWEDACKRWDAGERDVRGKRCETVRNEAGEMIMHITQTSWGIGVNSIEYDDEEDEGGGDPTNPQGHAGGENL
jgi:hypothetical protein